MNSHETRSFRYLGNVPVVRWAGNPQRPIDQLLKETLRIRHSELVLQRDAEPGDELFTRPPELITTATLPGDTKAVLYPDPPLGVEESQALTSTGVAAQTPLSRRAERAHLEGKRIALSMSPSSDVQRYGFSQTHLREAMIDLSRYLLISGATLVYGGHLGEEGYTVALAELVRSHNQIEGVKPFQRVEVYLSWPQIIDDSDRSRFKAVAHIIDVPRPDGVDEKLHADLVARPKRFSAETSPQHRYAWAKGMTNMRTLTAQDDGIVARIVLGGRTGPTPPAQSWYASRIPGVLEEVLLSIKSGQPVFLIGAFGGVPALVMDVINGEDRPEMTWEYQRRAPHAVAMREIYEARNETWLDYDESFGSCARPG